MNTIASTTPTPATAETGLRAKLRRAFLLSGLPYMDGPMPPL